MMMMIRRTTCVPDYYRFFPLPNFAIIIIVRADDNRANSRSPATATCMMLYVVTAKEVHKKKKESTKKEPAPNIDNKTTFAIFFIFLIYRAQPQTLTAATNVSLASKERWYLHFVFFTAAVDSHRPVSRNSRIPKLRVVSIQEPIFLQLGACLRACVSAKFQLARSSLLSIWGSG